MSKPRRRILRCALLALTIGCAGPLPGLQVEHDQLRASVAGGRGGPSRQRDYGWTALALGQPDAAERALRAAGQGDALTRFGLGLLFHDTGRVAEARDRWATLLERYDARDPWAPALAEVAAHRLLALAAEPAGTVAEERDFAARLFRLWQRATGLPPEARQLLAAATGQLLRLHGREDDARRVDTERGCPEVFYVGGPNGHLPRLDLLTAFPPDDPARDPGRGRYRRIRAHGCALELDGAQGRPGVMHAVVWAFAEKAGAVPVVIESGNETWALYVDGALRHHEREPLRRRHLYLDLPAGWHALSLKVSVPAGRAQLQLALPGLRLYDGPPAAAPATAPGGASAVRPRALTAPPQARRAAQLVAREMVLAQHAFISGDTDAGLRAVERARRSAPRCPPLLVLYSGILADDNSRPQRIVRDRVRRALETALKAHPGLHRTRLNLAHLLLQEDHPDTALQLLDDDPRVKTGTLDWEALLLRHRVLKRRGWLREAEAALKAARARGPAACAVHDATIELRRELKDDRGVLDASRAHAACNPYSERYAEALRAAGDLAGAAKEYRRLLALEPESESYQTTLADLLTSRAPPFSAADLAEARRLLDGLITRFPRTASHRVKLANLLLAHQDKSGAEAALRAGLAMVPESQELQRALRSFGAPGPMDSYRRDGLLVISEYKQGRTAAPGAQDAAVIVLDRTVTRVLSSGARLTLTHNIIHVLSKDGADKFGEVQLPEGAEVLTLRTVKADGGTREPEEIAEKDSVSVPDLEQGDYVEFEYIDRDAAAPAFPRGFVGDRFFFASGDASLFRTEYMLVAPWDMKLQLDRRGPSAAIGGQPGLGPGLPAATEARRGDERVITWARQAVPRLMPEPPQHEGLAAEWIPSVRPASGVRPERWRDYVRDRLSLTLRENDELRHTAQQAGQGAPADVAARALRLCAWVRRNIKQTGSLDEAATEVLARREGHRVTLLAALLRSAGVPFEMLLVRPLTAPLLDGEMKNVEVYTEPLLAVQAGGRTIYLDPAYRHAPGGFVRPALRGGQALRVFAFSDSRGAQPARDLFAKVDVPAEGAGPGDRREVRMEMALRPDGSGEVTVRERLIGWPAVEWREELERLAEDKVRQELEQRSLGFYFPGSSLEELKYGPVDDDDVPLEVRYRFRAPRLMRLRKGGNDHPAELVLPAPYPALLSKRYVGVPQRHTPLLLSYVVPTVLDAVVRLPEGAGAPRLQPEVATGEFGRFVQRVKQEAGTVRLYNEFTLPIQRVPPQRYPDFVRYARRVDAAEDAALVIPLK